VRATDLRTGMTKSCGCLKSAGNNRTHGRSRTSLQAYRAWKNLRKRCTDPTNPGWKNYGGRGIGFDPSWNRFESFIEDMGEPPRGASIDRINNDGNYCKSNCRWTDRRTQRINSRGPVRWVNINGERLVLIDAVRKFSPVKYTTVLYRIYRGWSEEDAILSPLSHRWSRRVARDVNKQQV
jgi:hypothetical protein